MSKYFHKIIIILTNYTYLPPPLPYPFSKGKGIIIVFGVNNMEDIKSRRFVVYLTRSVLISVNAYILYLINTFSDKTFKCNRHCLLHGESLKITLTVSLMNIFIPYNLVQSLVSSSLNRAAAPPSPSALCVHPSASPRASRSPARTEV